MAKRNTQEIIKCPRCGEVMVFNTQFEFWKCPACDGEFWPDVELNQADMSPRLVDKMVKDVYQEEIRVGYVPGTKKKGGAKSGRKRKKPKKSPDWAKRYVET